MQTAAAATPATRPTRSYGLCSYGLHGGAEKNIRVVGLCVLPIGVSTLKTRTTVQGKWSFRLTLSPTRKLGADVVF